MKSIHVALYLLFFALAYQIQASDDFKVLSKSGSVELKSGSQWSQIKTGKALATKDQIRLGAKSYIALIYNKNKKSIEINKQGVYDLKKIATDAASSKNVSGKLTKYFADELSSSGSNLSKKSKGKGMQGNLAAVDRGVGDEDEGVDNFTKLSGVDTNTAKKSDRISKKILGSDDDLIRVRYPKSTFIIESKANFVWSKDPKSQKYTFKIYDNKGKSIFEKSTTDTTISIDFSTLKAQRGANYYWKVKGDNSESFEECINYLNDSEIQAINNDIKEIFDEAGTNDSPIANIAAANYLSEKGIVISAYNYYQKALEIAPESEEFQSMFIEFLMRNNCYEAAYSVK
jgi:tetratricopeptide (TPR) repeat protein